jgi:hypothetical protein
MMRNKKLGLVALLMVALMVSSVAAWTVIDGGIGAGGQLTVEKAEVTVGNAGWINLGDVGSGKDFSGSGAGSITIINAKELVVTFAIDGLDADEQAAIDSGILRIWIGETEINSIDLLATAPVSVTVLEGSYTITYSAAGVAAYPEADVSVEFLVTVTVETP